MEKNQKKRKNRRVEEKVVILINYFTKMKRKIRQIFCFELRAVDWINLLQTTSISSANLLDPHFG